MKFSQVALGTRSEQKSVVKFRGTDVTVLFRPLSLAEEMDAEADAIQACKERGAQAVPGNPIYESARMVGILIRGCLDADSPADKREPFFDLGPSQVAELDTDTIGLLFERQQIFQEEVSPSVRVKTNGEIAIIAKELANNPNDPLAPLRYSPKTRLSLVLFLVGLHARSLDSSSSPGLSAALSPPKNDESTNQPSPSEDSSNSPTPTSTRE